MRSKREKLYLRKAISLSLVVFIIFSFIDFTFACESEPESCCCSVESLQEVSCCESSAVSSCSLERSTCDCGEDSHLPLFSLPSNSRIDYDELLSDIQFTPFVMPRFYDIEFSGFSRGPPKYSQPESSISLFSTQYWPTIRLLC